MAGEDEKGQVQPTSEGVEAGTKGQDDSPEAKLQRLSAIEQELADLKAQRKQEEQLIHALKAKQSQADQEIARVEKRWKAREEALQSFVRGQMQGAGATPEEITQFDGDFNRFSAGLSDKEKATLYEEMIAEREERTQIQEAQEEMVKGIAEAFEVEIPLSHPDLNKDDPRSLQKSALKVAQKLAAEKAKGKEKDALTKAAETGALGALGTGPGGVANPLAGITDPDKLWDMIDWDKIPGPSKKKK